MAETKPTKVARWATDGGRTLEPASGEKDVGWEVAKKAPARFMNWLQNVAYNHWNWLLERLDDGKLLGGGVEDDFSITVPTAKGTDTSGLRDRLGLP